MTIPINSAIDLTLPVTPTISINFSLTPKELYEQLDIIYKVLHSLHSQVSLYTGTYLPAVSEYSTTVPANSIFSQNTNRIFVKAGAALSYGNACNLYDGGAGVLTARKADATNATVKRCHAICIESGGIASGSYGAFIIISGLLVGLSGLTIGSAYYLSTTPGTITVTAPTAPDLIQELGVAISATELLLSIDAPK